MNAASRQRRKLAALLVVALVAGGVGVLAYATNLLRRSELQTIDARYSIRGSRTPPSNIVFVQISPAAEQELEAHHLDARSPLPRRYDAEVIDRLRRAGAKAIAVDIEFTHRAGNEEENDELIEAVGRARGKVVLATVNVTSSGGTSIFGGEPTLREFGARPAEVRLTLDSDGSVRRFEREYNHLGSFPVVTAEVMTGRRIPASTSRSSRVLRTLRAIPSSDWNSSKRRVPSSACLMISSVQRSPTSSSVRAIEQFSST